MSRRTILPATLAALALALTACGGTAEPKAEPSPVPGLQKFIVEQYPDKAWSDEVTGATLDDDGVLHVATTYPDATDADARELAKEICTAGKMYVNTKGSKDMDGTVMVEDTDGLSLGTC